MSEWALWSERFFFFIVPLKWNLAVAGRTRRRNELSSPSSSETSPKHEAKRNPADADVTAMACSADKQDHTNPSLLDVWNAFKRISDNTNSLIKNINDLQKNYNELQKSVIRRLLVNTTDVLSGKYVNHRDTSLWISRSCCTNAAVRAKIHLYLLLVLSFLNAPSLLFPLPL